MNVLSLFAGIGGIDLGLQWAGMTIVGQVEIDPWCRRVLAKHWPEVPRHDDVRTFAKWWVTGRPRPDVDLLCGGFPCQPISLAGRQLGEADERWLWPELAHGVRALRPRYVLLENVTAIRSRGWQIWKDLAASGYDMQWDCLPASAFGAPHQRDRWFCVAYPAGNRRGAGGAGRPAALSTPRPERLTSQDLADADRTRLARQRMERPRAPAVGNSWWELEPDVGRMAHGIPRRVDRIRGLGNAVVPQIAEYIGRLILEYDTL